MALNFGQGYMPGLGKGYSALDSGEERREKIKADYEAKREEFKVKRTQKFNNEVGDLFYNTSVMSNTLTPNAEGNLTWSGSDSTLPSKATAYKNYKLYAKRYGQDINPSYFDELYNGMTKKYYDSFKTHIASLGQAGYDIDDVRWASKNNPKLKAQIDALVKAGYSDVGVYNTHKTGWQKFSEAWEDNPGKSLIAGGALVAGGTYAMGPAITADQLKNLAANKFQTTADVKDWNKQLQAMKKKNPAKYTGKGSKKNIDALKKRVLKSAREKYITEYKGPKTKLGKWTQGIRKAPSGVMLRSSAAFAPTIGQYVGGAFGKEGEIVGEGIGSGVQAFAGGAQAIYGAQAIPKTFWQYLKQKIPSKLAKHGTKALVLSQLDSPVVPVMDVVAGLAFLGLGAMDAYRLWNEWNSLQKGK